MQLDQKEYERINIADDWPLSQKKYERISAEIMEYFKCSKVSMMNNLFLTIVYQTVYSLLQ